MRLLNWLKQFIGLILGPFFIFFTLGIIGFVGVWAYYTSQLPSEEVIKQNIDVQLPLKVYSKDHRLIAEFGQYRRRPVKITDEATKKLSKAFIAIEDSRFYEHKGVDFYGVARVIVLAIKNRNATQGASTITMQVARNFFLNRKKKLDRKLKEVFLAGKLERIFSKDEILELYLNKIFLGKRAYGVGSAAEVYYGKTIDQLTLAQSAMIAGLPKAPSAYNPIKNPKRALKRRNYILLRMKEQNYISAAEYENAVKEPLSAKVHARAKTETDAPYVAEMVRQEVIKLYGEEQVYRTGMRVYTTIDGDEQALAVKSLRENLIKYHKRHGYYGPIDTISLNDFVDDKSALLKKLKSYRVYGGLIPSVVTKASKLEAKLTTSTGEEISLPLKKLKWARKHINERSRGKKPTNTKDVFTVGDIVRVSKNEDDSWELTPVPKISGALVSMNPKDGAILAIVGGFDFRQSKFNRATQAKRQPGSSFKPFVYSAALAKGYSPASVVNDAPINIKGSKWHPQNYSGKNYGPTRLRYGLKKSRNLVSIQLLREIGVPYVHEYVQKYGFNPDEVPKNLTMALGTGSVTPVQMAGAYSTFANGGFKIQPHFISHIIDRNGEEIFNTNPVIACPECETEVVAEPMTVTNPENMAQTELTPLEVTEETATPALVPADSNINKAERIMKPYVRYEIVSMLHSVATSGTAARTRALKRNDIAGKTGTTNDQKDAWFAGFVPKKVGIVWMGFDQIQPMGRRETATGLALPTWMDFMKVALKDTPETPLIPPKEMVTVSIDMFTGFRADQTTPEVMNEILTREQIPDYVPNNFLSGSTLDTTFIRVNNPVKPTISLSDRDAMDSGTSNTATKTITIDQERFEIPEQLF